MMLLLAAGCSGKAECDLLLRNGTLYDGCGSTPVRGDLAIQGNRIADIGSLSSARGRTELDSSGMAIAPGFINMMWWTNEPLIEDGRSQSDIRQGVRVEVLGEGSSMAPLNESMKRSMAEHQGEIRYKVEWTTLGEFLEYLERRGVSPNVASFIGAATPRVYVIGHEDRTPTPDELEKIREPVGQAMKEGALGVASSLIYPPGSFARTEELVARARVAAEHGGMHISHMRSGGSRLLEAVDELLTIARQAGIRAEICHLKSSGRSNWPIADRVVEKI